MGLINDIHEARRLLRSGKRSEAHAALDAISAEGFATFHIVRAECWYAEHQYERARQECERALAASPNSPRAELLRELAGEMIELERTIRPMPTSLGPVQDLTAVQQQLTFQNTDETRIAPQEAEAPLASETLASIMIAQGKFEEARKVFIQLSRLHPERDDYYHERIEEMQLRMGEAT